MINYLFIFDTEEEADAKIALIYSNYHPAGYGTLLNKTELPSGQWEVRGYRGASCD